MKESKKGWEGRAEHAGGERLARVTVSWAGPPPSVAQVAPIPVSTRERRVTRRHTLSRFAIRVRHLMSVKYDKRRPATCGQ
jgi:hypothetical protein